MRKLALCVVSKIFIHSSHVYKYMEGVRTSLCIYNCVHVYGSTHYCWELS